MEGFVVLFWGVAFIPDHQSNVKLYRIHNIHNALKYKATWNQEIKNYPDLWHYDYIIPNEFIPFPFRYPTKVSDRVRLTHFKYFHVHILDTKLESFEYDINYILAPTDFFILIVSGWYPVNDEMHICTLLTTFIFGI